MKLYVMRPKGRGKLTFMVCAASQEEAMEAIRVTFERYDPYDYKQCWGTDYYRLEVYETGQVAVNDND